MSDEMTAAWRTAIAALRADAGLRCVVLTGAGSAFSSGGDLSWLADKNAGTVPALRDRMLEFYRTWLAIRDLEVPTVAALNGHAVGAGLCLALACDLRYAAEDAKLLVPFTALGLHPGMAATWLLPEVAGLPLAREMLFTGRAVTGTEAASSGLVNRAVPRDRTLAEALSVAELIAAQAPIATRLTKVALSAAWPQRHGRGAALGVARPAGHHDIPGHAGGHHRPAGAAPSRVHRRVTAPRGPRFDPLDMQSRYVTDRIPVGTPRHRGPLP